MNRLLLNRLLNLKKKIINNQLKEENNNKDNGNIDLLIYNYLMFLKTESEVMDFK